MIVKKILRRCTLKHLWVITQCLRSALHTSAKAEEREDRRGRGREDGEEKDDKDDKEDEDDNEGEDEGEKKM